MKRDEFSEEQKKKIIKSTFKGKKYIYDPAGRKINKDNAVIDHIVPAAKGGKATLNNAQVLHPKTNLEKSDKLSGNIGPKSNPKSFKVNTKNKTMIVKKKK